MARFRGVAFGPIGAQNLQIGAPWLMDKAATDGR
jgi:hypothetical protein